MYHIVAYNAKDGWRWRIVAPNGEIVADSAEAYDTLFNVNRAITALRKNFPIAGNDERPTAT